MKFKVLINTDIAELSMKFKVLINTDIAKIN